MKISALKEIRCTSACLTKTETWLPVSSLLLAPLPRPRFARWQLTVRTKGKGTGAALSIWPKTHLRNKDSPIISARPHDCGRILRKTGVCKNRPSSWRSASLKSEWKNHPEAVSAYAGTSLISVLERCKGNRHKKRKKWRSVTIRYSISRAKQITVIPLFDC